MLKELYEKLGYPSLKTFWDVVKEIDPTITKSTVKEFLDKQSINEIYHKKKETKNGMILALVPAMIYQLDLIDMKDFSNLNSGNQYIAVIVDVYSRKMWAFSLKNKSSDETYRVLHTFLQENKCMELMTDDGKEWMGKFKKLLTELNITHDAVNVSQDGHKALGIVDRAIRTLKGKIYKAFAMKKTAVWSQILSDMVSVYNDKVHSFTEETPNDLWNKPNPAYNGRLLKHATEVYGNEGHTFKVGDSVRVAEKAMFHRGFAGTYSKETFKVVEARRVNLILSNGRKIPADECILASVPVNVENIEIDVSKKDAKQKRALLKEGLSPVPVARELRERKKAEVVNIEKEVPKPRNAEKAAVVKRGRDAEFVGWKGAGDEFRLHVRYPKQKAKWVSVDEFIYDGKVANELYKYLEHQEQLGLKKSGILK